MVRQTFVWWVLYILYKFVKFPIRHLGLAIGNVWRFSPTLQCRFNWVNRPLEDTLWYKFIFILLYHAMISIIYQLFWAIFLFYCNFWRYWQHHEHWVSIYQTSSFLFSHRYLFLTETFRNIWCMHLEERLWQWMKICLSPQIFTVLAKQMQDINTSEKASNSNLPLIISMVKGARSRSLWPPISVIQKKNFILRVQKTEKRCIVREEWHRFVYIREWSIIV